MSTLSKLIIAFMLFSTFAYAESDVTLPPVICQEADGSPTGVCSTIKFPNTTLSLTGNAATYTAAVPSTATALAANGANCTAGQFPLGVDASGAVESCTALPSATTTTAYAAGTVYSLTNTAALLDFGTTDPSITISQAGTYLIFGRAYLKYNAATYAGTQTATIKLRRTNNTAADVSNATTTATMRVITTLTDSVGIMEIPVVIYTTANTDDVIQVFGSVSAAPAAGSVDATEASIVAVRIS